MKPSVETPDSADWRVFSAKIVPGHQVASGGNRDPRFPGGTIRMQIPPFLKHGLDLSPFHPGTVNVSILPLSYQILEPAATLRNVKWHPTEPAEDFSFLDVELDAGNGRWIRGYIYHPHPETKPEHFQKPDVLELLLPFVSGLEYGAMIQLKTRIEQIRLVGSNTAGIC